LTLHILTSVIFSFQAVFVERHWNVHIYKCNFQKMKSENFRKLHFSTFFLWVTPIKPLGPKNFNCPIFLEMCPNWEFFESFWKSRKCVFWQQSKHSFSFRFDIFSRFLYFFLFKMFKSATIFRHCLFMFVCLKFWIQKKLKKFSRLYI
jgi:hypothetical protein